MRRLATLVILALPGCGGPPTADYPALLPTDQLLADPALPAHAAADPDAVGADLAGDRGRLQGAVAEAQAQPAVAPDLAARGAALRDRARAISAEACAEAQTAGTTAPGC